MQDDMSGEWTPHLQIKSVSERYDMGIEFLKSLFADEDGKDKALTFPEFESALSAKRQN